MQGLDDIKFSGVTVWWVETATDPDRRYQANIKLRTSDGWYVHHGRTAEEALAACLKGVMRGEGKRDPDPPAERARRLIATVASEDEEDRKPRERARREPTHREDDMNRDGVDLFTRNRVKQERKRR